MGKRGFIGKGYSLKMINKHVYCYVWEDWDDYSSKEQRKLGNKNYSRSNGWKSLGNWNKKETHDKLNQWLYFKYGHDEAKQNEIKEQIKKDIAIFNE